ncbi:MAG: AAA family ATPase [Fimbriimonadaceae bacterium]|nr:AAA family ATPase [Fimbriimonadaceae bacterium]
MRLTAELEGVGPRALLWGGAALTGYALLGPALGLAVGAAAAGPLARLLTDAVAGMAPDVGLDLAKSVWANGQAQVRQQFNHNLARALVRAAAAAIPATRDQDQVSRVRAHLKQQLKALDTHSKRTNDRLEKLFGQPKGAAASGVELTRAVLDNAAETLWEQLRPGLRGLAADRGPVDHAPTIEAALNDLRPTLVGALQTSFVQALLSDPDARDKFLTYAQIVQHQDLQRVLQALAEPAEAVCRQRLLEAVAAGQTLSDVEAAAVRQQVAVALQRLPLHQRYAQLGVRTATANLLADYPACVGREEQSDAVVTWLKQSPSGHLLVAARAGFGKTALLADLQRELPRRLPSTTVVAHYFRTTDSTLAASASAYAHLSAQLLAYHLNDDQDAWRLLTPAAADETQLADLLRGLLAQGPRPGERLVLQLDALDERQETSHLPLPRKLPDGVHVILSVRARDGEQPFHLPLAASPDHPFQPHRLTPPLGPLPLAALAHWLGQHPSLGPLASADDLLRQLHERCQGYPLLLHYLLRDLAAAVPADAADDAVLKAARGLLDQLPEGFRQYLVWHLDQLADQPGLPLLYLLLTARGPLPSAAVREVLPDAANHRPAPLVSRWIRRHVEASEVLWALDHPALAEAFQQVVADDAALVAHQDAATAGLHQLLDWCRGECHRADYALRHTARHLIALTAGTAPASWCQRPAGSTPWADRLVELCTDYPHLQARHRDGQVHALGSDLLAASAALPADHPWRLNLRLLAQAVRRHLTFLDRHRHDYPQSLWQCVWNEAWWYDCAAAATHYQPPAGGWGPAGPPWERPEPRLSSWLERHRAAHGGQPWLRAGRPPKHPLGGAELACFTGHTWAVTSVAWSPDGQLLASGSFDQTVRICDAASGAELACLTGHTRPVNSVAWSPDGERLASGSEDHTVRIWDAASGDELHCLAEHTEAVNSVAWSPDGQRLASGSYDDTVRVWDAASGDELVCVLAGVRSVAWSPDGERLAGGSWDQTVRVWDSASGDMLHCLTAHTSTVNSVAWSPDGERLASGSEDQTVRIWEAASGDELHCLPGHTEGVADVAWSPDGQRLASGSEDHTVRVWEAASGAELHRLTGHAGWVISVAWSPDGRRLASGSFDQTLLVWEAGSDAELPCLTGHTGSVNSVAWSPDGQLLASGSYDQTVRVWEAASGDELHCLAEHTEGVEDVAWSPDGQRLDTSGRAEALTWDTSTWCRLAQASGRPLTPSWTAPRSAWCAVGQDGEYRFVNRHGAVLACARFEGIASSACPTAPVWAYGRSDGYVGLLVLENPPPQ